MTTEEFSNEFDILVDSYRRFKAYDSQANYDSLEFDEYEKSVFLTKAQEEIVLDIYRGGYTSTNSFEQTEENRRYLQSLLKTHNFSKTAATNNNKINGYFVIEFDLSSVTDGIWFIVSESFVEDNSKSKLVVPVKQDDIYKTLENPFKNPNDHRVLRSDKENKLIIYSTKNSGTYSITYLKKLQPIVLAKLNGITIDEQTEATSCAVDSSLHRKILERAVALGIQSKAIAQK